MQTLSSFFIIFPESSLVSVILHAFFFHIPGFQIFPESYKPL